MFGFACRETDQLMPLPIMLAHRLCMGLSSARRDGVLDYLRPDGKSQVTVEYENGKPLRVDAIVVSNHGGRQLDDVPATIAALPAIADAVGDRCEVLMDGGVRSGLDVVKALALGARACLIGRPWAYAVAADGQRGVEHVLRIMKEEIRVTMGLTGTTDLRDVDRSILIES